MENFGPAVGQACALLAFDEFRDPVPPKHVVGKFESRKIHTIRGVFRVADHGPLKGGEVFEQHRSVQEFRIVMVPVQVHKALGHAKKRCAFTRDEEIQVSCAYVPAIRDAGLAKGHYVVEENRDGVSEECGDTRRCEFLGGDMDGVMKLLGEMAGAIDPQDDQLRFGQEPGGAANGPRTAKHAGNFRVAYTSDSSTAGFYTEPQPWETIPNDHVTTFETRQLCPSRLSGYSESPVTSFS